MRTTVEPLNESIRAPLPLVACVCQDLQCLQLCLSFHVEIRFLSSGQWPAAIDDPEDCT